MVDNLTRCKVSIQKLKRFKVSVSKSCFFIIFSGSSLEITVIKEKCEEFTNFVYLKMGEVCSLVALFRVLGQMIALMTVFLYYQKTSSFHLGMQKLLSFQNINFESP